MTELIRSMQAIANREYMLRSMALTSCFAAMAVIMMMNPSFAQLRIEGDHMSGGEANADLLADRVVVVARGQRQCLRALVKRQVKLLTRRGYLIEDQG